MRNVRKHIDKIHMKICIYSKGKKRLRTLDTVHFCIVLLEPIRKKNNSVCLFVSNNVKMAEPIGPNFCMGHHMTPGKVYE